MTPESEGSAIFQNTVLIYNPFAGSIRRNHERLRRVVDSLRAGGAFGTIASHPTTGPQTAGQIASDAIRDGADLILVAGGDGTINEVMNGMVHSTVPLGILPGGTANVLSMEIGLGSSMERAAGQLSNCVPARISVGLLRNPEPRYFLLMAGIGLDAEIIYGLNARLKAALGKVAYWIGGFGFVGRNLPQFHTQVSGREIRTSFVLASRVRNYGGDLEIAKTVSLVEDDFEFVLFEGLTSTRYLKYFLGIATGRLDGMEGANVMRATEAALSSAPGPNRVHVQVDGEYAGELPATVAIIPSALTLLLPPAYIARSGKKRAAASEWKTSLTR